ncbi:MAG: hypothetical protein JWR14_5645 [Caballeronia sp.]|jgi:hypothetical protein|nr:hypothetical protein [Caballeronia sp.]
MMARQAENCPTLRGQFTVLSRAVPSRAAFFCQNGKSG